MNIRAVKGKIKSFSNTKKITKAMQLVSAVKMKKAQVAASEAAPYQEFLQKSIRRMSSTIDRDISPLLMTPEQSVKKKLVILITSNKGLCGSFNFNVMRYLLTHHKGEQIDYVTIGKKGSQMAGSLGRHVLADFSDTHPLSGVSAAFAFILAEYMKGVYQSVSVVYNRFISASRSEPIEEVLLPFKISQDMRTPGDTRGTYLVEPDPALIIEELLKNYVEEKIRFAIMQSEAGEHSARMIAMKNATDNANEVVGSLTQLSNKLRQQKITGELLDMITAKESVENT